MKVGSKVVCTNDNFHPETIKLVSNLPIKNTEYHIRDIFPSQKGVAVHLKEIRNKPIPNDLIQDMMFEPSFSSNRFVEVEDFEIRESIYEDDFIYA